MSIAKTFGTLTLGAMGLVNAADASAQQANEVKLVSNKATTGEVRDSGRSTAQIASRVNSNEVYENRLNEIIDRATKAGVLKSQEDFSTTLVQAGKPITQPNEEAYKIYVDNLKSRTRIAFPDSPNGLSEILTFVYGFGNGGNISKAKPFISKEEVSPILHKLLDTNTDLGKLKSDLSHVSYEHVNGNINSAKQDLTDLTKGKLLVYIARSN